VTAFAIVVPLATVWIAWRLRNLGMPIDLAVYRAAGRHVLDGSDIYVLQSGNPFVGAFGRGYVLRNSFTYPPFGAAAFAPLAWLPPPAVVIGWFLASLAALVAIVWMGFESILSRSRQPGVALGLASALFVFTTPVTDALFFGQIDLFIVLALLLDCTGRTRHWGIATGVVTAVKVSPALFILFFLLTRQWRACARAVATVVAITAVAWAILPQASWRYWMHPGDGLDRVGGLADFLNQSMYGALQRL
jgi:alpha-1,2-mannosyltransferase